MTRIKFCGLTRAQDVAVASELDVDAVGFVLWPGSPRAVAIDDAAQLIRALPRTMTPVGVFVRPSRDQIARAVDIAGIRVAQIHGTSDVSGLIGEPWELWLAAEDGPDGMTLLLDAYDLTQHGGTGRAIDWDIAARIAARRRVMLAGGLTPANVGEAIRRARPYGVDVSSGIEDRPGVKNAAAMCAFVEKVRNADLHVREKTI